MNSTITMFLHDSLLQRTHSVRFNFGFHTQRVNHSPLMLANNALRLPQRLPPLLQPRKPTVSWITEAIVRPTRSGEPNASPGEVSWHASTALRNRRPPSASSRPRKSTACSSTPNESPSTQPSSKTRTASRFHTRASASCILYQ